MRWCGNLEDRSRFRKANIYQDPQLAHSYFLQPFVATTSFGEKSLVRPKQKNDALHLIIHYYPV